MPEEFVIHLPIKTKRLLLRDFEPGDWVAVHRYAADPDVVRFVDRIFATVDPDNAGSQGVLAKVGMKYEGHFREHKLVRGKWRDTLIFSILESDIVE